MADSLRSHIAQLIIAAQWKKYPEQLADALLADPTIQITWKEGHGTPEDSPTETA